MLYPQLANEEESEGTLQVAAAAEAPPPYSSILLDGAGKSEARPHCCGPSVHRSSGPHLSGYLCPPTC